MTTTDARINLVHHYSIRIKLGQALEYRSSVTTPHELLQTYRIILLLIADDVLPEMTNYATNNN